MPECVNNFTEICTPIDDEFPYVIHFGVWESDFATLCQEMTGNKMLLPVVFAEEESMVNCQICLEWLHA